MKHPLKKLASAVLATALLASCMSVGFLASAAGSYVFTDKFGDNKFPKAVSVFVQGGGATDKCYGFTTNAPMVESMPDDREQVMMKCMTEVESSITYEFKEGFTSFEYIGYGGGGWAGIYGKSGLFKIQWSDTLGGTYRDFKQLVVGPNKGKSTDLAVGEMTLDRPDQDSAGLAYFYSNKIPSAAKYLRLWFKGAGTGDSYYEQWQAALVSLNVKANGADPDAGKPAPTPKPTEATTKPNSTTVKPDGTTEAKPVDATTAPSETAAPSDETTTAYTGATDEFGNPVRTTAATTAAPVVITSSNAAFKIDESWKTITVPAGSTVGDLAKALTIAAGYEIKLFDNASNPITSSSAELTKDTLVRLYKDGKVALTYTISPEGESSSGFPLWAIFAIIGGVIVVAGVVLLIVFRDKIFKKRV